MVRADMDEALAHDLIELMFDHKKELAEVHPSAEKLELEDAQEIVDAASSCTRAPSATTGRRSEAQRCGERLGRRSARCAVALALAAAGGGAASRASSRATATAAWSRRGARCPPTGASRSPTATRSTARPPRSASGRRRGGFVLDSVASPSAAVIDYYALDGPRTRERGMWVDPARPPGALRARWRSPPPGAGSARSSPAAGACRSTGSARAPAARGGGDDDGAGASDDRRGPRGVRGRAARAQARRVPGAARRHPRRRAVAVRDLLGLPAARRAGLPAGVPGRRAAADVHRLRPPRADPRPPTGLVAAARGRRGRLRRRDRRRARAPRRAAGDARRALRRRRDRCSCSRRRGAPRAGRCRRSASPSCSTRSSAG